MIKELIKFIDKLISIWEKMTESEREEMIDELNLKGIKYGM